MRFWRTRRSSRRPRRPTLSRLVGRRARLDVDIDEVYAEIIRRFGGYEEDGFVYPRRGPILEVALSRTEDGRGIWINYIERRKGVPGGAWEALAAAIRGAGFTRAEVCGENPNRKMLHAWLRRGFSEISEEEASLFYPEADIGIYYFCGSV